MYVCVAPLPDLLIVTCNTNMGQKVKRLVTRLCKGTSGRHLEHSTSSLRKACKSSWSKLGSLGDKLNGLGMSLIGLGTRLVCRVTVTVHTTDLELRLYSVHLFTLREWPRRVSWDPPGLFQSRAAPSSVGTQRHALVAVLQPWSWRRGEYYSKLQYIIVYYNTAQ